MEKIPVILVALNPNQINNALMTLNFNNANLLGIITETNQFAVMILSNRNMQIPVFSFSAIDQILRKAKNACWLICGSIRNIGDVYKTKKFLKANGVPEDNIVNFEFIPSMNTSWIANIRYIEKNPIDYFATGISYMEVGLNFQKILRGGVKV